MQKVYYEIIIIINRWKAEIRRKVKKQVSGRIPSIVILTVTLLGNNWTRWWELQTYKKKHEVFKRRGIICEFFLLKKQIRFYLYYY